ncbi:MAG: hypothetical protein K2N14_03960 [Clostridia bacterium]|nr:hypothetical protein [Clostridia bacterium]
MVNFDGEKISALIARKRKLNSANAIFFTVMLASALAAAVSSQYAEQIWALHISFICLFAVILSGFAAFNIFLVAKTGKTLKFELCSIIADAFTGREGFLDGKNIDFVAELNGDVICVTRKNFTGTVSIDPSAFTGLDGIKVGSAEIKFDLSALKRLTSVYSDMGTYIWEFFQAYYTVNYAKGKYENVRVTDNTYKGPFELNLVDDGDLMGGNNRNYYIKSGILK